MNRNEGYTAALQDSFLWSMIKLVIVVAVILALVAVSAGVAPQEIVSHPMDVLNRIMS